MVKISVVIPAYNEEKKISSCIKSVLDQSYNEYEIIVVDNNSSDKTKEIIHGFKNKKLKYIFEKNRGRGAARNAGINNSTGEIIAMIDCDCVAPKDWLVKISRSIREENENIVMGFERNTKKGYIARQLQAEEMDFMKRHTKEDYIDHFSTQNSAFKSSFIKKFMFDSRFIAGEDIELYLRIKNHTKVRFLKNCLVDMNHINNLKRVIKKKFQNAYWTKIAFIKNKVQKNQKDLTLIETKHSSKSLKNTLISFKKSSLSPKNLFFIIITGISWNLGTLKAIIDCNIRK